MKSQQLVIQNQVSPNIYILRGTFAYTMCSWPFHNSDHVETYLNRVKIAVCDVDLIVKAQNRLKILEPYSGEYTYCFNTVVSL